MIFNKTKNVTYKISALAVLLFSSLTLSALAEDALKETPEVTEASCGEITLYSEPPTTKDIYFAWVNQIDGETMPTKSTKFTLSAGTHRLKVIEKINSPHFTRRRGEMMNAKYIDIVIEANQKYALGAQYIRKNRSKLKSGEYWEPVVWKTTEAQCNV